MRTPPIFDLIARQGDVPQRDMFNTYNMGVGMCVTVAKADADIAVATLQTAGVDAYIFGEIAKGDEGIILC